MNSIIVSWFFKRYPDYFNGKTKKIVSYKESANMAADLKIELEKHPAELLKSIHGVIPDDICRSLKIDEWGFINDIAGEEGSLTRAIFERTADIDGLKKFSSDVKKDDTLAGIKRAYAAEKLVTTLEEEPSINFLIINTLQEVVLEKGGTFYLFYDKYQMVQGVDGVEYKLPDSIENSDCRLTLHYNCRNTKEIAQTSVTPLKDKKNRAIKPKTACSWFEPVKPMMHLVGGEKKEIKVLKTILDKYQAAKVENVVILTQGTIDYCCIADKLEIGTGENNGYYIYQYNGVDYRVTTCRKFKGLEADAIVMIDLDKESFVGRKGMRFYVGTSRAKQYLDIIAVIAPQDYGYVVRELDPDAPQKKDVEKMKKVLSSVFSADIEAE